MTQAAFAHDALLPQPAGGNAPGAALAVALTLSVDWRSKPAELVSAELWASVPQTAAPAAEALPPPAAPVQPPPSPPIPAVVAPAPAPPPEAIKPPEPDIAIAREQRRKADALRQQVEAAEAAAEAKKKQQREQAERDAKVAATAAAEASAAKQREANLQRMLGQAGEAGGKPNASGAARQDAAPSAAYLGRIAKLIRDQSVFTGSVQGNPAAEVEVRTGAGGTILSKRLQKSSGSAEWDEAVMRAIDKVGRLPPDVDGRVPAVLTIAFKPHE